MVIMWWSWWSWWWFFKMKGWGYWIFNTIELYVRFQSCTMFSNSCLSAKCSIVLSFPRLYPFQMKTPEWRSADKGFSSWSVLSTLPMASLSSALFFNFGSYSPYMDISSYLSLSPTFPTFFTLIRWLQGFPGFSSQVLSHPLFLVVPLNFCRQVFPPAFPEQSPLGNSAAAALECRCKDGSKKGGQEDIADWRGGSSPVHTHTRVDGLYFCISLF